MPFDLLVAKEVGAGGSGKDAVAEDRRDLVGLELAGGREVGVVELHTCEKWVKTG